MATRINKETRERLSSSYKFMYNDYQVSVRNFKRQTEGTKEYTDVQRTTAFRFGKLEGMELIVDRLGYEFVVDKDVNGIALTVKLVEKN